MLQPKEFPTKLRAAAFITIYCYFCIFLFAIVVVVLVTIILLVVVTVIAINITSKLLMRLLSRQRNSEQ